VTVQICTIIARNYLPFARVLATSFREHHPDGAVTVLVFDDVDHEVDASGEPFDVVRIDDLGEDVPELYRMAAMYDVTEFATALKPWLLEALLRRGAASVLYLDPDIQVFHPLDGIAALAAEHDIVLTPHVTSPMPRDGKMTCETAILSAGIYNLGFVAVGPGALGPGRDGKQPFLGFWKERLLRECLNEPEQMHFVDQRWVDFVPGIYDPVILREPVYNVAYWNLDHRDVQWTGGRYEVNGEPLQFFHFSGFNPTLPWLLSKHQGDRSRILLSERPTVRRLCDEYGDRLLASGYGTDAGRAYAFGHMANGVPLDRYARRVVVDAVLAADEGTDVYPPLPWDVAGADALCDWLRAPPRVPGDPGNLSVYLATVYGLNVHELRPRFFDPQGADRERFLAWAAEEAEAGNLAGRLVGPVGPAVAGGTAAAGGTAVAGGTVVVGGTAVAGGTVVAGGTAAPPGPSSREWAPPDQLRPGFLVAGYLRAELGVGEAARLLIECMEEAHLPYSTFVVTDTVSRQDHDHTSVGEGTRDFTTAVVYVNADQTPSFAATVGPGFFAGRHVVGGWAWELEEFPERWHGSFDLVDEVWAPSEFARAAIAAATDLPVFTYPHPIVVPEVTPGVDRAALGLPEDRFVFLFCFDLLSILERKNPLGLIEAFIRAFPEGGDSGPVLVLKVINGERAIGNLERLRLAAIDRPDILVVDGYLSSGEVGALMDAADCYVSLHRSEGYGLTMGEAMALGKPVIATGYSGNLDFMTAETAYLVPWEYGAVPPGCDPYPAGAKWAEPDLEAAARIMRQVADDPAAARAVGQRARQWVLEHHGLESRAGFLRTRLREIEADRARERARVAAASQTPPPRPGERYVRRILQSERLMRYPRGVARRIRTFSDPQ